MARVKRSVHGRKRHRAVLEQAKGYYGNKSRSYRAANEQLMHSMQYAYRDRRARKGDFRKLWIQRINAGARGHGLSYSRMINGLHLAGVEVDRKLLADLAVSDPAAFAVLVETAQAALAAPPSASPSPAGGRGRGRFLTQRLAFTHRRVRRVRGLLQKRSARWSERAFVAEGAELIRCALDAGATVESVYVSPEGADDRATQDVCRRAGDGGRAVFPLGPGCSKRVADTVHAPAGARRAADAAELDEGADAWRPLAAQGPWWSSWSTCGTRATPARVAGRRRIGRRRPSCTPPTRSIPTTPRRCGPRPAPSSTSRWRSGPTRRALASELSAAGVRTFATVVRAGDDYAAHDLVSTDRGVPRRRVVGLDVGSATR